MSVAKDINPIKLKRVNMTRRVHLLAPCLTITQFLSEQGARARSAACCPQHSEASLERAGSEGTTPQLSRIARSLVARRIHLCFTGEDWFSPM